MSCGLERVVKKRAEVENVKKSRSREENVWRSKEKQRTKMNSRIKIIREYLGLSQAAFAKIINRSNFQHRDECLPGFGRYGSTMAIARGISHMWMTSLKAFIA